LDDGVVAELTDDCAAADVPGFGELTELLGGDDVDGLLASLPQSCGREITTCYIYTSCMTLID